METLHTARLILRPLAKSDAEDLFGAMSDAEVMKFWDALPDAALPETIAPVELFLADVLSGNAKYWTIRHRSDEGFVGICDLSEIHRGNSAEIGLLLARKQWGLGFGGEVVRGLLEFAKSRGVTLVTARIHEGNARSQRLLVRAGFRLVQAIPQCEIRPGVFRDCLRFEAAL
jgi:RimJ/RimL family protein N-acetyltransferase